MTNKDLNISPYLTMSREDWARQRGDTPMTLTEEDVARLGGLTERLSVREVEEIYLPLSRLLNLYVAASQNLHDVTCKFLGQQNGKMPFILGIAGSVACGKSTTARVMKALLARWPNSPKVALISTDGFLRPNKVLEARGLMDRKGFPESFDSKALLHALSRIKAGEGNVQVPIYSHHVYDIVPDQFHVIDRPDILIVEGLNVLQPARLPKHGKAIPFVSDYFDFSIYIDAQTSHIEDWYVTRFRRLCETHFKDADSYFHRYSELKLDEIDPKGRSIWKEINEKNLVENILPTRQRADLIIRKSENHAVDRVKLRKL